MFDNVVTFSELREYVSNIRAVVQDDDDDDADGFRLNVGRVVCGTIVLDVW